jgi:2-aminoadipate transaminase
MRHLRLSDYGEASLTASPVNRMMALFADDFRDGVDINLGVGYVNEDTIPRDQIVEATREVLSHPEKYRAALNYGGPSGSQNLIDSIRRFLVENHVGGLTGDLLDRRRLVIGPNGATSLLESLACVLSPGIVITSDPVYYIYCDFLERRGFEVLAVPEDDQGIRTNLMRQKLEDLGAERERISFVYVVTVSNPTGTILSNERRADLVEIVTALSNELGRHLPLVADRAYEDLVHDPTVPPLDSPLVHDEAGIVYEVGTLSKVLAPALRIGYLIGSDERLMDALVQRTSDAGFSAPLVTQEIASYMLDHHVRSQIERVNSGYRSKALAVRRRIDSDLGEFLETCSGGAAGFYYYLTFRATQTAEGSDFFRFLARTTGDPEIDGPMGGSKPRVIYVPGVFCVHPQGDLVDLGKRQLRISYGFEDLGRIETAIGMMREAADYAGSRGGRG